MKPTRTSPLYIGAAKANVGHGEAAAGVISFIKTLLVLQKEAVPRHVGIKNELTPHFPADAEARNLYIPYDTTPWLRSSGRKRIAVVNNFGAAGGNTCMVIEEGPVRVTEEVDPRTTHVISVSAKNSTSFRRNMENLINHLDSQPSPRLQDLAYTTTARKAHFRYRRAVAVSGMADLKAICAPYLDGREIVEPIKAESHSIAFAFTGQGSFYAGMAKQLFTDSATFRNHILTFDGIAKRQGFESFLPAILAGSNDYTLIVRHLTIVCIEMALLRFFEDLGVTPKAVIGHSLGEISALFAASVICASDAIFLVGRRAQLLEQFTESNT